MYNTMSIRYEERNGKKYAYRCTSKRMPGKKNPVSIKEYLGVVDPETGNLIPKKVSSDSMKFSLKDGSFRVKDYGNVMVAKKVCDDLCLLEDLSMSFAGVEKPLLCLAMAQALLPTPYMDTNLTLESTYIRESVGIGEMDFSSQRMSEIARTLGEASGCMEDLFALRARRSQGNGFLYDITSQSTYSDLMGMAEWGKNRDGEDLRQMNIGLVTNDRGDPIAFDLFPGSIADMITLKRFVRDMRIRVPGCTLIMDRGFENAGNVAEMMSSDIDFVMPCTISSKAVKRLLTDFAPEVTKPEYDRIHNGHVYSVRERTLGIVENKDGFSYVTDDDPLFDSSAYKVRAYVCFDSKKRSDDEQELKKALMAKMKELEGKRFEDPARSFNKKAGWLSKYLDYTLDDEGLMRLSYKNNAMTFFRNRAGMFVMITPRMDWETVMTSYDARNNVEMAFDVSSTPPVILD